MIDTTSKYYPYQKTQEQFFTLEQTVFVPRMIADYLIDAPTAEYTPPDDNSYPRARLWKWLYYDGAKPLENTLPMIGEKMSVVFDPTCPEKAPTPKGYRLIPQIFIKQSQTVGQTRVHIYMGRSVPSRDDLSIAISVIFDIYTHYTYEANSESDEYSRCLAIEQAIIESLHGVNMTGVGSFYMSKSRHPDCGSTVIYDGNTNVGRRLTMALEISTTIDNGFGANANMPLFDNRNPNIKIL